LNYLHHRISLAELVSWSEQSLIEPNYEDDLFHTIRNILAQLAASDVKAFGLEWQDCENVMDKLGFKLKVTALQVA
jgi:hypothetical protein